MRKLKLSRDHLEKAFILLVGATLFYLLAIWAFPPVRHGFILADLFFERMPSLLPVPLALVPRENLEDTWGAERDDGRKHEGLDILAAQGTPVLSTTRGIVFRVGVNPLGGNRVLVIGPGAYLHYYAHLSAYGKFKPGDYVETGDVLGYVGNTGNASHTPPHLHYGIYRWYGMAINPYPLLGAQKVSSTEAPGL